MDEGALPAGCEERCPACRHRTWSRDESERQKRDWLKKALSPWVSVIAPVVGASDDADRWGYRRKTCLHAEWGGSRWKLGMRVARGMSVLERRETEVIDVPGCPVHSPEVRSWLSIVSSAVPGPRDVPLSHVLVSGGLVTLVIKAKSIDPSLKETLARDLGSRLGEAGARGLFFHFHPSAGNRVTTNRGWEHLWGEAESRFRGWAHGPESFLQLLPELYEGSFSEAERFLFADGVGPVIDLCSGIGASLARWTSRGARAIGVELGGESVRFAEINAPGAEILRGRCSDRLPQLREWAMRARARLLYANPPRLGLESDVLDWIASELRPVRMAYLSCSAGTLARDLSVLSGAGYAVRRITPYDFFPQTHHVETLALLERA